MRNSMAVVSGGVCFLFLDEGRVGRGSSGPLLVLGHMPPRDYGPGDTTYVDSCNQPFSLRLNTVRLRA